MKQNNEVGNRILFFFFFLLDIYFCHVIRNFITLENIVILLNRILQEHVSIDISCQIKYLSD